MQIFDVDVGDMGAPNLCAYLGFLAQPPESFSLSGGLFTRTGEYERAELRFVQRPEREGLHI